MFFSAAVGRTLELVDNTGANWRHTAGRIKTTTLAELRSDASGQCSTESGRVLGLLSGSKACA